MGDSVTGLSPSDEVARVQRQLGEGWLVIAFSDPVQWRATREDGLVLLATSADGLLREAAEVPSAEVLTCERCAGRWWVIRTEVQVTEHDRRTAPAWCAPITTATRVTLVCGECGAPEPKL